MEDNHELFKRYLFRAKYRAMEGVDPLKSSEKQERQQALTDMITNLKIDDIGSPYIKRSLQIPKNDDDIKKK